MGASCRKARVYEPRQARRSPLYRLVIDELETWVSGLRGSQGPGPEACAEDSLRAFLACGVERFGVARFRCGGCGENLFVPFSCKRRMSCPSCDAKRSAIESEKAASELLPEVPYRQWVLVVPKRLRYFVHRDKRLPGELSRILAAQVSRFYARKARCGVAAQMHAIQRFGSRVNLHVHVHAVVSDGAFTFENGVLKFRPAAPPSVEELAALSRLIRHKVLLRMRRLRAVPEEVLKELLARHLGGFSLNGSVRIEAEDRAGLLRLLGYITRPAISVKRLSYKPQEGLVRYWPKKGHDGLSDVVELKPSDFLARFARIIPPARVHLIRYHGALGPRSPLREAVTQAARERANFQLIRDGIAVTGLGGAAAGAMRAAREVVRRAARSWAACLGRVFEVYPLKCAACGGEMKLIATISEDKELDRLLSHLGLETDFPKALPSRSPPAFRGDEDTQVDPAVDWWDGVDEERPEE